MKKLLSIVLVCCLLASLAACTPKETGAPSPVETAADGKILPPKQPKKYSVGAGSVGGNFYLMGGGIASVLNKHLKDYFLYTSETTGGSTANLTMLEDGDAELGIAMTAAIQDAKEGEASWTQGKKHEDLRTALALYPSWLTVYTKADSGIERMEDLTGRIVGLGSKGMSMDTVFRSFFEARGIEPKQIHNDGHGATASALGDDSIDVAVLFSFPPFAAIAELESSYSLRFIPLTEEEQAWFLEHYDFYQKDAMPAGSYAGAQEEVPGVSEWNMLMTSAKVPAEDVYLSVKALFENQKDMIAVHPSAKYMTPENVLNSNTFLHAGVVRYLEEIGIEVPEALIPPEAK